MWIDSAREELSDFFICDLGMVELYQKRQEIVLKSPEHIVEGKIGAPGERQSHSQAARIAVPGQKNTMDWLQKSSGGFFWD